MKETKEQIKQQRALNEQLEVENEEQTVNKQKKQQNEKDFEKWSKEEVGKWIEKGLSQYPYLEASFLKQEVTGDKLLILTNEILQNTFNIAWGARIDILSAISKLKEGIYLIL